jgi:alpha-ketoglutarate-dependent taurine dioxygenase
MFHCLVQTESEGGVNQWIDGFHAAHRLYEEDQELFDILIKTPIAYRNITRTEVGECHTTSSHKLIRFGKVYFITCRYFNKLKKCPGE